MANVSSRSTHETLVKHCLLRVGVDLVEHRATNTSCSLVPAVIYCRRLKCVVAVAAHRCSSICSALGPCVCVFSMKIHSNFVFATKFIYVKIFSGYPDPLVLFSTDVVCQNARESCSIQSHKGSEQGSPG